MRADMSKIIVERPRLRYGRRPGSRYDRGKIKTLFSRDPELAPRCQSMTFAVERRKWLNENLAPLARFLRSSVGRKWDAVFSEISTRIDASSAVQHHILEHIDDFVARDAVIIDGRVSVYRYGDLIPIDAFGRRRNLYVCPRTGILRALKRPR